jgi:methanol metabolism-related c-type cytochrome
VYCFNATFALDSRIRNDRASKDGQIMISVRRIVFSLAGFMILSGSAAIADPPGDPKAVSSPNGEYMDKDGNPTYNISKDGTVDWYTNVGFVQYGANCLSCHGPDGLGSSYAPSLVDALKSLSYADFTATVIQGKKDVSNSSDLVMPSFGENKNIMCYLDPIYIYLRARSTGALGRGRPDKMEKPPAEFDKSVNACFGN